MLNISNAVSSSLDALASSALNAETIELQKQQERADQRGRGRDAHKDAQKHATLKLLALGPDNIGALRLIQKMGIEIESCPDTWAVAVRGIEKVKVTVNTEFRLLLGVDSTDVKKELAEMAPRFLNNHGCAVLFLDPHDKCGLDVLDSLVVLLEQAKTERMSDYMPCKCILVELNSRPDAEPALDEHDIADWCTRKHPLLQPQHVRIADLESYKVAEQAVREVAALSYQLRVDQIYVMEMEEVFGLIDTDGGGSIDKDEFYELMCMVGLGDSLTRDEADAMIDKVDVDGSGEVEFDEFLAVMTRKPEHKSTNDEMVAAFEYLTIGTATEGLNYGEARLQKMREWLELYRPNDATLSLNDAMELLERCESEAKPGVMNFLDFVEINS